MRRSSRNSKPGAKSILMHLNSKLRDQNKFKSESPTVNLVDTPPTLKESSHPSFLSTVTNFFRSKFNALVAKPSNE